MKRNLIETYADSVIGKNIDYDNVYNSQCVDLIKHYTKNVMKVEIGPFGGSAKSGFANKSNTFNSDWIKIVNNPQDKYQVPSVGDIIFFDGGRYSQYGHVGIVYKAFKGEDRILVLDQNNGNGSGVGVGSINACKIQEYSYSNVVGWYRHSKFIFDYKGVAVFMEEQQPKDKPGLNGCYIPENLKGGYITIYPNAWNKYKDNITSLLEHEYAHYVWFEKLNNQTRKAFGFISKFNDKVKNNPKNTKIIEYTENAFINKRSEQFITEDFAYIWQEYYDNPNKVYGNYLDYKKEAVISLMGSYA